MKSKQLVFIILVVALVHVVLLLMLKSGHGSGKKEGGQQGTEEIAKPEPSEEPSPVIPPAPEPPSPDPLDSVKPYGDGYFTRDIKPLPASIKQMEGFCKSGIAIDLDSKRILWEKDPKTPRPMASLTKMMTALVAVRKMRLSNGTITPDTMIKVTAEAVKINDRQVWLDPRESFSFTDILKCIMIHSANDCAYLMAEYMGNGNVQAFVEEMNSQARELGCRQFTFVNPHGLPAAKGADNSASPVELAYLASVLLDIPEITRWSGVSVDYLRENDEAYKKRNNGKAFMLVSSNKLLRSCNGVNGMKTGFTNKAGYCIVVTCERTSRRAVVVLMGCPDSKSRDNLGKALVDWIYQN